MQSPVSGTAYSTRNKKSVSIHYVNQKSSSDVKQQKTYHIISNHSDIGNSRNDDAGTLAQTSV